MELDVIDNKKLDKDNLKEILGSREAILCGPISDRGGVTSKKHDIGVSIDGFDIAQSLDLYANVVHAFSIPGFPQRHNDIDIVMIRENSEGEYSMIEHEIVPGVIESVKIITRANSLRIAEYAFDYAKLSKRNKVTAVHKANIIKLCDGEFLDACREVAAKHPSIDYEEMIVDATCMNLSLNPSQFDVMVMPNLYGSIIGSVITGLVGGPGITPGASIGNHNALFEQGVRADAQSLVQHGSANPTAFLLAATMMIRHNDANPIFADIIQGAIFRTLEQKKVRTPDMGGNHTMHEYMLEIIKNMRPEDDAEF